MRQITTAEILELTSLLSMETVNLANAKTIIKKVQDAEFRTLLDSFIQMSEGKVKSMQQFINENNIIKEVH